MTIMLRLILCALWLAPLSSQAAEWPAYRGDLDEFDNIQRLPGGEGPDRLVLGDNNGRIHVYEERDHTYTEVWDSDYLEGAVAGRVRPRHQRRPARRDCRLYRPRPRVLLRLSGLYAAVE